MRAASWSLLLRCILCTGPAPAALGHELHRGHQAVHATALWRRPAARRRGGFRSAAPGGRVQVEIGVHEQRFVNVTTKLEDMVSEYIGTIGVGTTNSGRPQFNARVVFDTGSTNLWVASVLCKDSPCQASESRRYYDPQKSMTAEPFQSEEIGNNDIDIMFGTGELRGPLHADTYRVGPLIVKKQPFAMIREMSGDVFSSFPFEGILGLGFKSLSFGGIEPFFEHVIKQKLLQNNEFAFYLNSDSGRPSALLWGGVDPGLYEGPIRMFPVVQPHYWSLELLDFRYGNKSLLGGSSRHSVKRLIVDSGTTYFTAPSDMLEPLMEEIPPGPCFLAETYDPLVYVLRSSDGEPFELEVKQDTYMLADEDGEDCHPAFMRLDIRKKYGPAMILGEVFMRHYFTVFSRGGGNPEEAKVGIARARRRAEPDVSGASFLQQDVTADGLMRRHMPS